MDVHHARDGARALDLARTLLPHVILLDIGLPGIDGYEVARRVRQEPDLRNVCLAAVTGYMSTRDLEEADAAGFDHHLAKPVDADALRAVIIAATAGQPGMVSRQE